LQEPSEDVQNITDEPTFSSEPFPDTTDQTASVPDMSDFSQSSDGDLFPQQDETGAENQ